MAAFYRARGPLPPSGLEEETVLATGRFFDDALRISPHASVALYSLGNAALLQRATDEVVDYMRSRHLLGPRKRTLELGCGAGRMQFALAPHVMEAAGADVSAAMIAAAQKRRGPLTGVRFFHAPAHRLAAVRDGQYDVVFAVDSFPYIVNAGPTMVASTFAEMRRVLSPNGRCSSSTSRTEARRTATWPTSPTMRAGSDWSSLRSRPTPSGSGTEASSSWQLVKPS